MLLTLDSVVVARGTLAPLSHTDTTPTGRTLVRFAGGRMRGTADSSGRTTAIDRAVTTSIAVPSSTG